MAAGHKKALYNLAEGWLELESDPGLFTLLMEDMGVQGVQVEEIYDLGSVPLVQKKPCYGAIFLFKWVEDRRSRRKIVEEESLYVKDEEEINKIFFAQQIVPNSCATHALVSILLNCPQVNIGDTLRNLKNHVAGMNPENKGLAIGNSAQLAYAHNSHAVPRARRRFERSNAPSLPGSRYTGEAFHFVSYVPINNRLFELDGLRRYPIDHGPIEDPGNWTEKLREVIQNRLGMAKGGVPIDIRFALMALVPESRRTNQKKLKLLEYNRDIVMKALQQLLEIYRAKKRRLAAEELLAAAQRRKQRGKNNSFSGTTLRSSTRSCNNPSKFSQQYMENDDFEEDEILYVDPGSTEEALKMDREVSGLLADFNTVFKDGVSESDAELTNKKSDENGLISNPANETTKMIKTEDVLSDVKVKEEPKTSQQNSTNSTEAVTKEVNSTNNLNSADIKAEKGVESNPAEAVTAAINSAESGTAEIISAESNTAEIKKEGEDVKLKIPGAPLNKPLLRVSRGSSAESAISTHSSSQPPLSPFQSNPLLTAHDYSKSPLMEGIDEDPTSTSPPWNDDILEEVREGDETEGEKEQSNASVECSTKNLLATEDPSESKDLGQAPENKLTESQENSTENNHQRGGDKPVCTSASSAATNSETVASNLANIEATDKETVASNSAAAEATDKDTLARNSVTSEATDSNALASNSATSEATEETDSARDTRSSSALSNSIPLEENSTNEVVQVHSPEFVDVKYDHDDFMISEDQPNDDQSEENEEAEITPRYPLFSHALHQDLPNFDPSQEILPAPNEFQPNDLLSLLRGIEMSMYQTELSLRDDMERHNKHVSDDCRRVHDYDEFFNTFLFMLAEQNMLADLVEHGLGFKKAISSSSSASDILAPSSPSNGKGGSSSLSESRKKVAKKRADDSESDWSESEGGPPAKQQCKVLYHDPSLPSGWKRRVKKRGGALSHGKYAVSLISPEGKLFRTKGELRAFLSNRGDTDLHIDMFDFSVTGSKRTIRRK